MATAEQLASVYADLNFPSASVFRKALIRRGIPARAKDVEEFVQSRTERQVVAPPPKYEGHVVAFDINHRWAADLISFVSRPAKSNEGTYTHVLLVQDIFSRFLMAKALKSVSEATDAFEEILKEAEDRMLDAPPHPRRLDTDGGPEFANAAFRALLVRYKIEHIIKDSKDYNALATLDRAMGVVKRALARRQEAQGGNWLSNLDATIEGYNKTEHGGIDAEPSNITDDIAFSLHRKAATDLAENTALIRKRQEKLEKTGGYRVHQPKSTKGLRQRIDANTWSRDIHETVSFPAPGVVEDAQGNQTLTKFAKAVPWDSSRIAPSAAPPPPDDLQPFALMLRDSLPGRGQSMGQAAKEMKRRPGFADSLKAAKLSFQQFVSRFPLLIRVHDGRLYSKAQQTLA